MDVFVLGKNGCFAGTHKSRNHGLPLCFHFEKKWPFCWGFLVLVRCRAAVATSFGYPSQWDFSALLGLSFQGSSVAINKR
jgi:hypothetical protein